MHCCALQSSRERDAYFNEVTVELTVAYLRLGSSFLRGGRFTRALQHFKQGVHLFDGAQAKGGVAACYCCLGALFIRKAGPGTVGATGMSELVERQAGCDESLRHFDLALQVRPGPTMFRRNEDCSLYKPPSGICPVATMFISTTSRMYTFRRLSDASSVG